MCVFWNALGREEEGGLYRIVLQFFKNLFILENFKHEQKKRE